MRNRLSNAGGFSLIEMVVVIVIIAVVAGVGIAKAGSGGAAYRARLAAQRVASDLELARRQSLYRAATVSVDFDVLNDRYTITGLYEDGGTTIVDLSLPPFEVGLTGATVAAGTTMSYNGGVASTEEDLSLSFESSSASFDATIRTSGDSTTLDTIVVTKGPPG